MTNLVDRAYIERKCDQLVAARFWPPEQHLRYRAWLRNFTTPTEVKAAATILDRFVFINQDHAALAVSDGYSRLLGHLHDQSFPPSSRTSQRIRDIHQNTHFAPVRGESPNLSESGNVYMRVARETLKVKEDRIHELAEAITACANGHPLVLLDDFSGTGNQLMNTLTTPDHSGLTLMSLLDDASATIACITAVMTSGAIRRLHSRVPSLLIFPGYTAPEHQYGIDALLPAASFPAVHALLSNAQHRLTQTGLDPIRGLNGLGLLLGVHDQIPDASLPILWADGNDGWTPLKRRNS